MECPSEPEYAFETPDDFWNELEDVLRVPDDAPLEDLDAALRTFIAVASRFMDEYLSTPGTLAHAILLLLEAPLFTSHVDRMMDNVVSTIADPSASSSSLFFSLMIVIFLRDSVNPLTALSQVKPKPAPGPANTSSSSPSSYAIAGRRAARRRPAGTGGIIVGSSKIFRRMRKRWKEVVPVLMKWVWGAAAVQVDSTQPADQVPHKHLDMPADGWEERVGTTAVAVLYEMCRVQKLDPEELADFTYDFVKHLFALVERTRDVADETFNYTLIKLIIALNEQFMVSSVPVHATGNGKLPPPILPTVVGTHKRERGPNTVLEVLKEKEYKTFGENVIFILNRADDSPDSLCVSLLILKILYLLFTTSGTQEYFYTNDLCVLVDVFIRELYDLGEESEGLKHTYLRVLHPLLNNTQLRHYPYKRQELRECLESLLAGAQYRDVDPTTRRLVERNLRGTWCQGLRNNADLSTSSPTTLGVGVGCASTLSVDAVAVAAEGDDSSAAVTAAETTKARRHPRQPSGSLSGGEPHRKSRKHASADDLRHHHHHHQHSHSENGPGGVGGGDDDAEGYCSQCLTTTNASFSPHAISRAEFAGPATLEPALAERYNVVNNAPVRPYSATAAEDLTRSAPSIRIPSSSAASGGAGGRGGVVTSPPTPRDRHLPPPLQVQLQHPRPRSSSLSAACHASLGLGVGVGSRDSTAPPSPALSNASLSGSVDSSVTEGGGGGPTSPSDSTASRHGHARRRRRPPPPPIEGGLAAAAAAGAGGGTAGGSRPLTPLSRASTAGTGDGSSAYPSPTTTSFASPAHSASSSSVAGTTGTGRRRPPPPPPPKPGGLLGGNEHVLGSEDKRHHDTAESDARRLLDGLAVSS